MGEFTSLVKNLRLQACLRKLGLDMELESAAGLFSIMDMDGDGQVNLDEFALTLRRVHGNARGIDLARIQHDMWVLQKSVNSLGNLCSKHFSDEDESRPPNNFNARHSWLSVGAVI